MFGTTGINSTLTLGKVINGISKSLNIVNQVIPIYMQAKPMITKAKDAFKVLKIVNTPTTVNNSVIQQKTVDSETAVAKLNSPTFFH